MSTAASEIHPALRRMSAADGFADELREARDLLAALNRETLPRWCHNRITLRIHAIDVRLADAGVQP